MGKGRRRVGGTGSEQKQLTKGNGDIYGVRAGYKGGGLVYGNGFGFY